MNALSELFQDCIKDLYNAEKQLVKALPKLEKTASEPQLKKAIREHLTQTLGHVERLESVARQCGFKPTGMVCNGMKGLIEEADEHLKGRKSGPGTDAEIIMCAQKAEHYEMCAYGTARTWAKELGLDSCVGPLEQTLTEEDQANDLLTRIAETKVNRMAIQADGGVSRTAKKPASGTKSPTASAKSTTMRRKVSVM